MNLSIIVVYLIELFFLQVALVEDGYAAVHPLAERSEYGKQLKYAEEHAKNNKLRRWKDFVETQEEEQQIEEDKSVNTPF